jgi:hypothetical protein
MGLDGLNELASEADRFQMTGCFSAGGNGSRGSGRMHVRGNYRMHVRGNYELEQWAWSEAAEKAARNLKLGGRARMPISESLIQPAPTTTR